MPSSCPRGTMGGSKLDVSSVEEVPTSPAVAFPDETGASSTIFQRKHTN